MAESKLTRPMQSAQAPPSAPFGALLADYRARAGVSQLTLAFDAGVSARHLGFLERGRSRPSVDMVTRLAGALSLGRAERDRFLLAAGYAPERRRARLSDDLHQLGQDAFATAMALSNAGSATSAVEIASAALRDFGLNHFISGVIHRQRDGFVVEHDPVGKPAVGWLRYMQLRNYSARDYLVRETASRDRAYFWEDVSRDLMTPDQQRILDEARDFRIHTGFVVPVHRPDGTTRALSSWAERVDPNPATRVAATLVAHGLLEALDRLSAGPRHGGANARLNTEHRDALLWVADGCNRAPGPKTSSFANGHSGRLIDEATAVMGSRCAITAAARAATLGLLDNR
jgi:transcriptional regulator with XRE-family HTH domain